MVAASSMSMKRCVSCGGEYLISFFRGTPPDRRDSSRDGHLYRDRCMGCDAAIKRSEILDRRLRRKAMEARRRHGVRLAGLGVVKSRDDLDEFYGWSLDRMVSDIKRVLDDGCSYCTLPVSSEQGFGGITLDILDPEHPPHYVTNVRWCCSRCNSEKQRVSPEVWGARRAMWDQWRRNRVRRAADPLAFGFLPLDQQDNSTLPLW